MKKFIILIFLIIIASSATHGFVSDGEPGNAATFNSSFMSREIDTDTLGDITIKNEKKLKLEDNTGGEFVSLRSPTTLVSTLEFVLPGLDGTSGQVLLTDGAGVLSFGNLDLTSSVITGVTPISKGGTNSGTALTGNQIMTSVSGAIVELGPMVDGDMIIGSTGLPPVIGPPTGTTNQVNISLGAGSLVFGLPQDIDTGASIQFFQTTTKKLIMSPDFDQNLTAASDTIDSSSGHIELTSSADFVMTALPSIAAGVDGQMLLLHNIGTNTIDLQDEPILTGSNVFLGGAESTIKPGSTMTLFYSTDTTPNGWSVTSNPNSAAGGAAANVLQVRNVSGSAISANKVVYITGKNVGLNRTTIDLADADDPAKFPAIGFTFESISNNANGEVVTSGTLDGINTSTASINSGVWIGTTPGEIVFVRPSIDQVQRIGTVTRVNVNGSILVNGAERGNDVPNQPSFTDYTNTNHDHETVAGGGQLDLTAAVTGILPGANGGTGITSTATFPSSGIIMTRLATEDISGKTFLDALLLTELAVTPATPATGDKKIYCLVDDKCYQLNDAGAEIELGAGGGFAAGVDNSLLKSDTVGANDIQESGIIVSDTDNLSGINQINIENEGEVRFEDNAGGEYMGFKAPSTVTASTTFTFPDGDGAPNQVMQTNGSAVLSWVDNPTAVVVTNSSSNKNINATDIANSTSTFIDFPTSDFDDDSNFSGCGSGHVTVHDTGCKYIARVAGTYIIHQKVEMSSTELDADESVIFITSVEDTAVCRSEYRRDSSSGSLFRRVFSNFCLVKLAVDDVVEAVIFQSSGTTLNFTTGDSGSSFDVIRVDQPGGALTTTYHASISGTEVITNDGFTYLSSCTNADPSVCTFTGSFFANTPACWTADAFPVTVSGTTSASIDRTDAATAFTLICNEVN